MGRSLNSSFFACLIANSSFLRGGGLKFARFRGSRVNGRPNFIQLLNEVEKNIVIYQWPGEQIN